MQIIFQDVDLTGVKGILIDIDNTLYPYESAHKKAVKACYDFFKGDWTIFSFEEFCAKYLEKRIEVKKRLKLQGNSRSRFFAFQGLFEEMNIPRAFREALKYEKLYWKKFMENMELSAGALNFLKQCDRKKIRICVVSDMQARFQVKKLQTLEVDHLVDYLVTSEEVGVEKPDSLIFRTALKKLDLRSDEVVMIGDDEQKDIRGAESVGIRSFKVDIKNA